MANKEYKFTPADGMETTVELSDEDAKRWGLTGGKAVKQPADKQASPSNKSVTTSPKQAGGDKA
jgi:hypothetical protein